VIRHAVFGKEIRRAAIDSDNWPLTWGDDDAQYTSYAMDSGSIRTIEETAEGDRRQRLELLNARLRVFEILADNCRDAIEFQNLLDTTKGGSLRRPVESQEELTDIPEWRTIRDVARREIDNSSVLIDLLQSQKAPLIDLAKTSGEENIRVLGPDLIDQLKKRIKIMIAHWQDFQRLFVGEDSKAAKSPSIPH
jgi:hypothetical protein